MITEKAIEEFRSRPRDDFSWMKKLTEPQVNSALAALDPPPQFLCPLHLYQKVGVLLGISYQQFLMWYDMGLGKNILALELIRYQKRAGNLRQALMLYRTGLAVEGCLEEWPKWKLDLRQLALTDVSTDAKWAALSKFKGDVVLATYPGVMAMVCDLVKKKKGKGREYKINQDKLEYLIERFNFIVADEATYLGSQKSLAFAICNNLREYGDFFYELAGRPFGRNSELLWSQCYLIDRGEALGAHKNIFLESLFSKRKNYFRRFGYDYKLKKEYQPLLSKMIAHRSISYDAFECGKLPDLTKTIRKIHLPDEAENYCSMMIEQVIEAKGNYRAMRNVFMRMRQLSSGFLGFKDDETGERAEIAFSKNPKLDALVDLLTEVPGDRKALVFHEFKFSGAAIAERLKKEGIKAGRIIAQSPDNTKLKQQFDRKDGLPVLIVPVKLGAYSLNLQAANYTFVYESPVSPIDRDQMERRTRRQGQQWPCFLWDLVVAETFDERILAFHKEGDTLFDALVRNPQKVLGEMLARLKKRA